MKQHNAKPQILKHSLITHYEKFSYTADVIAKCINAEKRKESSVLNRLIHNFVPELVYLSAKTKTKKIEINEDLVMLIMTGIQKRAEIDKLFFKFIVRYELIKDDIVLEYSRDGFFLRRFLHHGTFRGTGLGKLAFKHAVLPLLSGISQEANIQYINVIPSEFTLFSQFYESLGFEPIVGNPNKDLERRLDLKELGLLY